MKIRITSNEFYQLDLPTEIGLDELSGIIDRLKQILKLGNFDEVMSGPISSQITTSMSRKVIKRSPQNDVKIYYENREKAVQIVKDFKSCPGPSERLKMLKEKYNLNYNIIQTAYAFMHKLKSTHNIKNEELETEDVLEDAIIPRD